MIDKFAWEVRSDGSIHKHLLHVEEMNFLHLMVKDAQGELIAKRVSRTSSESVYFTRELRALEYAVKVAETQSDAYQKAWDGWKHVLACARERLADFVAEQEGEHNVS